MVKKIITRREKLRLSASDIAVRAIKTFIQTFVGAGAVLASASNLEELRVAVIAVAGSALSAAVSVVWNSILVVRD